MTQNPSEEMSHCEDLQKLEADIAALLIKQDEVTELLLEKTRLRNRLEKAQAFREAPEELPCMDRRDSGVSMTTIPRPSYMNHTTSSRLRRTDSGPSPTAHKQIPSTASSGSTHNNGSSRNIHVSRSSAEYLSVVALTDEPSSQTHTRSSLLKKLPFQPPLYLKKGDGHRKFDPERYRRWSVSPMPYFEPKPKPVECEDCKVDIQAGDLPLCSQCDAIEAAIPSLEEKTRLRDSDFYSDDRPESLGPIPFHVQLSYKQRCESIAAEALWLALREHWPERQQRYFPEGPEQIRFGREDLQRDGFGDRDFPDSCNEMCGMTRSTVFYTIESLVHLRNSIAHRLFSTPSELDGMMQAAQRLAVTVANEELAMEVRVLRDEVQELAKSSWEEILRNQERMNEGQEVKWRVHHQRRFRGWTYEVPDVIAQTVRDWNRDHDAVGKDEEFFSRVETVKSWNYWKPGADGEKEVASSHADRMSGQEFQATTSYPSVDGNGTTGEPDDSLESAGETFGAPGSDEGSEGFAVLSLVEREVSLTSLWDPPRDDQPLWQAIAWGDEKDAKTGEPSQEQGSELTLDTDDWSNKMTDGPTAGEW